MPAFPRLGLLIRFPERASVGLTDTLGLAGTEDSLLTRDLGSPITARSTVYAAGTRLDAGRTHATNGQNPFRDRARMMPRLDRKRFVYSV